MKQKFSEEQKRIRAEASRVWRKNNPEKAAQHSKTYKENNRDKIRAQQRKWVNENKEKQLAKSKEWYHSNKDRVKNTILIRQFGITLSRYNEMAEAQNGKCAICDTLPDSQSQILNVDHCHKSGKVRSLLCRGCNVGLGNLKDDPILLEKAATYIRKHSE